MQSAIAKPKPQTADDLPLFAAARSRQQTCTPRAPARQIPGSVPAEDLPADVKRIADLLQNCIGKDRAMKAREVAEALDLLPDRNDARRGDYVRRLITPWLDSWPYPLAADPSHGYFQPATADEVTHYDRQQTSRIREQAQRQRSFRLLCRKAGYVFHAASGSWTSPADA